MTLILKAGGTRGSMFTAACLLSATAAVLLAGCGAEAQPTTSATAATSAVPTASPSAPSATPTPTSTPSPELPTSPSEAAKDIESEVSAVVAVIQLTEDNDTNNLIGRPGQYDAATFMADKRLGCSKTDQFDELGIDCGAKIERWASEDDATARAADIQKKLKEYGLGAEYDYVRGNLLLRVSGKLKPSQAKEYLKAFPEARSAP
ncbi:hypothetical protein [Phycicoccus sonneratiae]|uniref:Lipoprotein n=1 Tax=Phycicoccus sonneratiae TaxID=2807628 RepID=A0ABS2CJY1_9MICO|nr:hypothetical protein [Phycicoccus sonneraticus]MBM6400190.1 hypothetical protein [Phycicoccus sonneraticus]